VFIILTIHEWSLSAINHARANTSKTPLENPQANITGSEHFQFPFLRTELRPQLKCRSTINFSGSATTWQMPIDTEASFAIIRVGMPILPQCTPQEHEPPPE
jgi:hypothetical protein